MLKEKPAIAQILDWSLNIANRPRRKERGGADSIIIPTRDLNSDGPQPNLRIPQIESMAINKGEKASQKLVFPNLIKVILLCPR